MSLELRNRIGREEFDYPTLMSALSGYASPRDRITVLIRSGVVVRVKKGLYVFGDAYRRGPYCRELLANLIYGPSMVSLEYALGYYGLIPERVEALTSVTTGRGRRFETPLGRFVYRPTPCLYMGLQRIAQGDTHFLMAVPERALADRLREDRRGAIRSRREMERYLLEDLRMDEEGLKAMDAGLMAELGLALHSRKVRLCAEFLADWRGSR